MTVSMVDSYSFRSAPSCLFSWRRLWFSMTTCALVRSSSDSQTSGSNVSRVRSYDCGRTKKKKEEKKGKKSLTLGDISVVSPQRKARLCLGCLHLTTRTRHDGGIRGESGASLTLRRAI